MSRATQGVPKATPAQVYAMATGVIQSGPDRCHYCGGPCERTVPHKEPIPILRGRPDDKLAEYARLPGNPYVCVPCQVWRRAKVTASFLGGGLKDGTQARKHAWYVTPGGAWAVGPFSGPKTYQRLLAPPARFFLMLLEGGCPPDNLLQLAVCNDNDEITATTPLHFTLNNQPLSYTIYELEQAAVGGVQGREPGAAALLRILGPVPPDLVSQAMPKDEVKEKGRPTGPGADPRAEQPRRVVREGKRAA